MTVTDHVAMIIGRTANRQRGPVRGAADSSEGSGIIGPRARSSVDRATDFGSVGRGFESLRARHVMSRDIGDTCVATSATHVISRSLETPAIGRGLVVGCA